MVERGIEREEREKGELELLFFFFYFAEVGRQTKAKK